MKQYSRGLMWFRRDLRMTDNYPLFQALRQCETVFCLFIFDTHILSTLPPDDRRVAFIDACLDDLQRQLQQAGSGLIVRHGTPQQIIPTIARELNVEAVFAGRDYEPQAKARDQHVGAGLQSDNRSLFLFKDQVIFETDEILNGQGRPYKVFTAYKNAWLKALRSEHYRAAPVETLADALAPVPQALAQRPGLKEIGFVPPAQPVPMAAGSSGAQDVLQDFLPRMSTYDAKRDYPALRGPSYLSVHLRFGTLSIRTLVRTAMSAMSTGNQGAATWLSELIWRDFYFMILHHYPQVVDHAFNTKYDAIEWESGPQAKRHFQAWCQGETGYPIVDAGMRQLNQTGYMHNRLRMIVASFLTKDLGIDWRRGERYFALKLNDFDLAANNGGWQWAASTGCDAQPYFRIFNPITQSQKFDPDGKFIRRYVPELASLSGKHIHAPWTAGDQILSTAQIELDRTYPRPIVDHNAARRIALARYGELKDR